MNIHPTAIVHKDAILADDVIVGPYSVIGEDVKIDSGTFISAHVHIASHTTIGKNNKIYTGAIIGSAPQDLKWKGEKSYLKIGDNNTFREYCTVNLAEGEDKYTVIGNNNLFMSYTHIAHNCIIGNNVKCANNATLAGHVEVEDDAVIGGLVGVHQFVKIGRLAMIGGMSKIVKDVVPFTMVDGNPSRIAGLNKVGMDRANFSEEAKNIIKEMYKIIFRSKMNVTSALQKIDSEIEKLPEVINVINFLKRADRGILK
jgi:UDP-N-acetylglucosamine acyltransferase